MLGGLLLGVSIFIEKTYEARPENPNAAIDEFPAGSTVSIWQIHEITGPLLLAAAAAPFILAWIIVRDLELSWPRGQLTMIVAIAAFGLLFYFGIIDRPGEPSGEIELDWSWYTAVAGPILMLVGSVWRQSESEIKRKPPGTI